jgi:hypothetical protein
MLLLELSGGKVELVFREGKRSACHIVGRIVGRDPNGLHGKDRVAMTINPILAQIETKEQVRGAPRQEELGRWLRENEDGSEAQPRRWQRAWLPGAVALGGAVAMILGFWG